MSDQDQFSRTLRGSKHQMLIQSLLNNLKNRQYIKNFTFYTKISRIGYRGLKEQFYFPFSIEFHDGEKWIIQSTTSFPRERINGYQWNALHFKKIDSLIKKVLVIYPDAMEESEIHKCINYHNDITERKIVSEIDGVISFADLYLMIEEKWLENEQVQKRKALQGTAFELWLVDILNHVGNISIWNGNADKDLGFNFPYFQKILTKFGFPIDSKILWIDATDEIPLLPPGPGKKRGGKPKTDIYVKIVTLEQELYSFTISSKRTSSNWVAIHQYAAKDYINVLNIEEQELKEAFYELEKTGAPTQISNYHREVIISILPKYIRALAEWAYAGIGGEGENFQKAEFFTIFKNETKELEIYHRDEYIDRIFSEVTNGQLGSPFMFTYTGTRGTNIQLKGRVI